MKRRRAKKKKTPDYISLALQALPGTNLSMVSENVRKHPGRSKENWSIYNIAKIVVDRNLSNVSDEQLVSAIVHSGIRQAKDPTRDM